MKSKSTGAGCVVLFALPFAAGGTLAAVNTIAAIRRGESLSEIALVAGVATAFCVVGYGMIIAALTGGKRVRENEQLRERHPDSPWLWNAEWASRRIGDDSRSTLWYAWAFTIIWNAVSLTALVFVPRELEKGNLPILLVLLFPLAGLWLLTSALRATLRALRFHRSTFVLDTLPAPVGGTLRGRVEVPYPGLRDASSLLVRLTQTVTTKSGKNSTTSVHWQEEVAVSPASLGQSADGVSIPVDITIPSDATPSDFPGTTSKSHEWRLTVDAELPGIDYATSFEVPVFRTAFTDLRPPRTLHTPVAEPRNSPNCRVTHTPQGLEIYFPPFRAPSVAIVTLVLGLIFSGVVWVLVHAGAPLFFPIFCGFLAFLLLWASYGQFFGRTTVLIDHEAVTIRYRSLFGTARKRVLRDGIASVDLKITTQQSGGRLQPWYEVEIRPVAGRRISVVNYVRSKRDAEWVAAQIRRR